MKNAKIFKNVTVEKDETVFRVRAVRTALREENQKRLRPHMGGRSWGIRR